MPGVEPPDESGGAARSTAAPAAGREAGGCEGGGASGLVLEENADERESGLVLEENADERERGRSLVLEDNVEEVAPKGSDEDSDGGDSSVTEFSDSGDEDEEAKRDAALLDDSRWVPETSDGETRLTLPPRNYTLVHEDGRAHKADHFEPLSFGMQRVHNDDEPEPVWVQTPAARWMQTASEVSVIPYKVPTELCRGHEIKVSFARRLLHVQAVRSKEIFMAGELEEPINPNTSTWTTDGTCIMITCIKENLLLYNGARGKGADSHWGRLFKHDQYVERGMIAANYYDVPFEIKLRNKIAEAQRKEKEKLEKEANLCPLCDKDVRFFCECRVHDRTSSGRCRRAGRIPRWASRTTTTATRSPSLPSSSPRRRRSRARTRVASRPSTALTASASRTRCPRCACSERQCERRFRRRAVAGSKFGSRDPKLAKSTRSTRFNATPPPVLIDSTSEHLRSDDIFFSSRLFLVGFSAGRVFPGAPCRARA
jgi:hypothetical protein